jgi:predicted Zn-dependent protease
MMKVCHTLPLIALCAAPAVGSPGLVSVPQLVAMIDAGDLDRAERLLRRSLPQAEARPAIYYLLGTVLLKKQELETATSYLRRAVELKGDRPRWRHALAAALAENGRCAEAIDHLDRAIAIDRTELFLYDKAMCSLNLGNLPQAVMLLEEVVGRQPGYPGARYGLGKSLVELGQDQAALPYLEAAEADDPLNMDLRLLLARMRERTGDLAGAELGYRDVLRAVPEHLTGTYALGRLLLRSGQAKEGQALLIHFKDLSKRQEAIENHRQYLALYPSNTATRLELARLLLDCGAFEEAGKELRTLLPLTPRDPVPYRMLAEARQRVGDISGAEGYLRIAERLEAGSQ